MLVARVVQDEVDNDFDVKLMGQLDIRAHIIERAVVRLDVSVVGNGVAVIGVAVGDGHEPHRADAELFQVVELARCAVEVSDAVAVRVEVTAYEDLIGRSGVPPTSGRRVLGRSAIVTGRGCGFACGFGCGLAVVFAVVLAFPDSPGPGPSAR